MEIGAQESLFGGIAPSHHLSRHEGSTVGHREKLICNAIVTGASANPTRRSGACIVYKSGFSKEKEPITYYILQILPSYAFLFY